MAVYTRDISKSIDAATHPWIAKCDVVRCYYIVSSKTETDAESVLQSHKQRSCPMVGKTNELIEGEVDHNGQPYTRPSLQPSIGEQLWDRLDFLMGELKSTGLHEAHETLKAEMRGIAFALHLMMRPYYLDTTAIAKEAAKRWRIKQGEQQFEPTPGYQFNPPPPGSPAYQKGVQAEDVPLVEPAAKTRSTRQKKQNKILNDQEKLAVKTMARSGSFEIAAIAKTYGITSEEVTRLRDSED